MSDTGSSAWRTWVDDACDQVAAAGRWRAARSFDAWGHEGLLTGDPSEPTRSVVSFASNDYLGLSTHPAVVAGARAALERWGSGSGASRLVTGSRPVHHQLEEALAEWKGTEAAILFPTGFAANLAVLSVFGAEGAVIHSDERNHASIIDGCRLARADVEIYPHGDLDRLDASLARWGDRSIVVTDTVFSMDGDVVDLAGVVEVCGRHGSLLILDEAHAVLGPHLAPSARVDVLQVGTLSKTLGSLGGFVAGPRRFIDLLVNRGRPYIFTTAPTPADAGAALAALEVLRSDEGSELTARLARLVARVAGALGGAAHPSPIVPVIIGGEAEAVAASATLLDQGLWVPAIRPPTVAAGTSRLRITLSATHTDGQVDRLLAGLKALLGGGHGHRVESRGADDAA